MPDRPPKEISKTRSTGMFSAKRIFIAFLIMPFIGLVALGIIAVFTQLVDFIWSRFDLSAKEGFLALFQMWFVASFFIGTIWIYYFSHDGGDPL